MRPLCCFFLLFGSAGFAQGPPAQRISFDLIGVDEGLPHATVSSFLDDGRGNLWIGMAEGLVVYNGSDFETVDLAGEGGPLSVRGLAMDEQGIVWVAAEQGPVRLDPVTRRAHLLPFPDSLKSGAATVRFNAVAPAGAGKVLFASHYGTCLYDTAAHTFSALVSATGAPLKTWWRELRADAQRGGIWLSTRDQGLVFYDHRTSELYETGGDASISPLIGRFVLGMCTDGAGGYWCIDRTNGSLCHWDGRSKNVNTWDHLPGLPEMPTAEIAFLARDSRGYLWGSGRGRYGGFRFNPVDRSVVRFAWDDTSIGALPYGSINALYEDANNCVWLANQLGIAIYDPTRPQVATYPLRVGNEQLGTGGISAMYLMDDSLLWCGMGHDGFARIDLRTGELRRVPPAQGTATPHVNDVVRTGGRVLLCTWDGVFSVDAGGLSMNRIDLRDSSGKVLAHQGGEWLKPDAEGWLWMGQLQTVVHFDPRNGTAIVHRPDSFAQGALRPDNRYCGAATSDGRFWLGGNVNGLACYQPWNGTWSDMSADVHESRLKLGAIKAMIAVGDTVLWLASNGAGLIRYDIRSAEYMHYDQRHGFQELRLEAIGVDARGRIWANSAERVFCFDPMRELAIAVDPRSSTGGRVPKWSIAVSSSGLVGMNVGREIAVFDGNAVGTDHLPPAPAISRILADGVPIAADDEGRISMRYDQTQLEVSFGALLPPGSIIAYAMRSPGEAWSAYKQGRVNLRGLRPGEHVFEFRVMSREGAWGPIKALRVRIPPPWWQTFGARVAMAVLLAAAIVLLFRLRLNLIRRRERKQEAIARTVNELKLQALRAQMDPHFIFNCLNSIDGYIVSNDPAKASHYLGRFAKLIRLILQYSDSTAIPLEREVEMLKYYLELEAQRFRTPFQFSVRMEEGLEEEALQVPTMLVQPFVENAIWHGLQHKEGQGHLRIMFRIQGEDLVCTVEDDGIGREASRRINEGREKTHRSMGMRVSSDRLELLRTHERSTAHVEVSDLRDPTGTLVAIHIPLRREASDEQA